MLRLWFLSGSPTEGTEPAEREVRWDVTTKSTKKKWFRTASSLRANASRSQGLGLKKQMWLISDAKTQWIEPGFW